MLALIKKISLFIVLLCASVALWSVALPDHRNNLVHDFSQSFLQKNQLLSLEESVQQVKDTSNIVISIVVESDPAIQDVFSRSLELSRAWGIGSKEQNNGVLIYIHSHHRRLFIQTGRGVEGFLPDAMVNRIIQELLEPGFKADKPYEVLQQAINFIAAAGKDEFEPYNTDSASEEAWNPLIIILIIVFLLLISRRRGGGRGRGHTAAPYMPGPFMGRGTLGGGFGGGAGSWGGFGGGGFGGGGAGGRW